MTTNAATKSRQRPTSAAKDEKSRTEIAANVTTTPATTATKPAKATQPPAAPAQPPVSPEAVYAGPAVQRGKSGEILAMRPAAYPEVISGDLRCLGCDTLKSARHFPFIGSKGSGKGRGVACRQCRDARKVANVDLKAAGKPEIPAPHATNLAEVTAKAAAVVA